VEQIEQMQQTIRQKLLDMEIDPTQPIDEKTLVRETGGSLTQVTQALERLAGEGLLTRERRRYRVSRSVTTSVLGEILEVRTTLEGMCARLAAERINPNELTRMAQVHREFERVIKEGDNKALITVDRRFHQLLYEASGNRFLARALDDMYALVYRLSYFELDRIGSMRPNVEEHRAILEAVRAGDGRSAERLIQQHIGHFQQMVEGLL
jgi:DNA-binding GntR family transcriptional regulator